MSRYIWIPACLFLVVLASLLGCGKGENVPLLAPGGTNEWPSDPGWSRLPSLLNGESLEDGIWLDQAPAGTPQVILVGSQGIVLEYTDGNWVSRHLGEEYGLRSVVQLSNGEIVIVGFNGCAFRRVGDDWQREDTGSMSNLRTAVAVGDEVWAVGDAGAVMHRGGGGWTTLANAGDHTLSVAAVLNDSLFVASNRGVVRIWADQAWTDLQTAPWLDTHTQEVEGEGALGLATVAGNLYAIADSVYVREPTGWRTITDVDLENWYSIETRVVGQTIWYGRSSSWYHIDPTVASWQPSERVESSRSIMAISGNGDYLASSSGAIMTWVEDGEPRFDFNGRLGVGGHLMLNDGGILLNSDAGVVRRTATETHQVLEPSQIPLAVNWRFRTGCGISEDDFYIVGDKALYHCVGGQANLVGTWTEYFYFETSAVSAAGELFAGESSGLYHWQGHSWQRVLPLLASEENRFKVWPLGDGRLGAVDRSNQGYYLEDGLWVGVGALSWDGFLLAAEDGTLFSLQDLPSSESLPSGNSIMEFDAIAGAFREPQQRGMGPLTDLNLEGATSQAGEVLVWTNSPAMIFSLRGAPAQGDWQVVAGPLDFRIFAVDRLPDGSILARVNHSSEFAIYRP